MTQKYKEPRTNISLTGDSVVLLERNKIAVEQRLGIKVTIAFVIKLALKAQAETLDVNK